MRSSSDESYVIDLRDRVLNRQARRQFSGFDFLRGDRGKNGTSRRLPVDAYYENLRLVVEFWERHHTAAVPIMDQKQTISVPSAEAAQEPVHSHNPIPRRASKASSLIGRTRFPRQDTLWCEGERDHSKREGVRQQASQCSSRAWLSPHNKRMPLWKDAAPEHPHAETSEGRVRKAATAVLRPTLCAEQFRQSLPGFPQVAFRKRGCVRRFLRSHIDRPCTTSNVSHETGGGFDHA